MMKLDLITSKDELRPTMCHILVNKSECVATNAHVIGVVPTSEIFNSQFISELGESTILIFSTDWKKLHNATAITWKDREKNIIEVFYKKGRPALFEAETEENVGKYPNWHNVIPEQSGETANMCFNPSLLIDLSKALDFTNVKLTYSGAANRAFRVDGLKKEDDSKAYGIIMPVLEDVTQY